MTYSKISLLDKAVEITKAYASSGSSGQLEIILKNVYEQLKKLNEDIDD